MKQQHTPGPWRIKGTSADWFRPLANGQFVDLTDAANAQLIAAAPELLDALQYMLEVCPAIDQQGEEAHQQARAAIAKVLGV